MILDELKKLAIEYQKSGDRDKLDVLRYFLAQVQNKEIELRSQKQELTDEIVFKILKKQVKDRKELIEIYQKASNQDKVDKETAELEILKVIARYFPFDLDAPPVMKQH